jgi:acetyl-CoA C-acetyltransferase
MSDVVILSGIRTPMGAFQGELSGMSAPQLGAGAIAAAVARAGIKPADVSETLMGNVLSAGREAAIAWAMARSRIICSSTGWRMPMSTA